MASSLGFNGGLTCALKVNDLENAVKGYEEDTADLTALFRVRDENVYMDDCVEIFFDVNLDRRSFHQIVVNSIGTIFDIYESGERDGDEETLQWNGDHRVAVRVEPTFWILEMEVPFRSLEVEVKRGDMWGFNAARVRIAHGGEFDQWVPTHGYSGRPERFGLLVFD